ncbi:MAG: hypothetical protein V2A64_04190 [Candidatus Omnitrophota bacterium]
MDKKAVQKTSLIIAGLCIIILPLVFLLFYSKLFGRKKAMLKPAVIKLEYGAKTAQSGLEKSTESAEKLFPDPFHSPLAKSGRTKTAVIEMPAPKDLTLEGIFYQKEKVAAIINDTIVYVGDAIGEKKVLDIREKNVILQDGDYQYILNFKEE